MAYTNSLQNRMIMLGTIAAAILFFVYDLYVDAFIEHEYLTFHFIVESVVFAGVSIALLAGIRDLLRLRTRLAREEKRLDVFSRALAESIDMQMGEWQLTPSEKEVAWLVVKGYRFSEIARARGVKENTARLQASSLYAKAGVSGRSEFVAEIIQSLLFSIPDSPTPKNVDSGNGIISQ
ncbi:MAG: helix-turn-helix transcriptional regulator [Albidovulum sp.]|nr:helix-turn-helix transcriptional regulator [Albidovulum sp.]